jgi:hypothetical protein
MNSYRIGKSIILPHIRYIDYDECSGMMFHSEVIKLNGQYQTVGCDSTDVSGLCSGHKMSREEFSKRYCGGVEAKRKINNE